MGRNPRSGFTLLELTVASLLSVTVATAAALLLNRGLTAWQVAEGKLQQSASLERGFRQLDRDLRNALFLTGEPFEGWPDQIRFAYAQGLLQASQARYALVEEEGQVQSLVRWSGPDGEVSEVVLPGIRALRFRYAAYDPASDGLLWQETWTEEAPPRYLRMEIEVIRPRGASRRFQKDFWLPQGQWKRSGP